MATSDHPLSDAVTHIKQRGFYYLEDSAVGTRMDWMTKNSLRFDMKYEEGYQFWHESVNSNPRIISILDALDADNSEKYSLGHNDWLAPDPNHIKTLRYGGAKPEVYTIQIWPADSEVIYYSGSHQLSNLRRWREPTGPWAIRLTDLKARQCDEEKICISKGGIVIFDSRIALNALRGESYHYTYFTQKLLEERLKEQPLGLPASRNITEVTRLKAHARK
ncbi:hypothetical protein N3K66_009077 [Trichothecium roseum]|uniref:Uncharacterized protein n=1 Tax=Trichothecium roseum TaxID=47278 RepID=A0ACC0UPI5_9HYPO|nr:hypothetical protein N3K66_009077 [Trichothecium roseum]